MLRAIEAYLALRRATGFAMLNAEYLLKSFAAFAAERGQTHVHTQTAIDWAACGPSVAQRDARLKAVCRFVRHVRVEDARHELPPVNHFGGLGDIDLSSMSIRVLGKGRRERTLPLWKTTAAALRAWLAVRGRVAAPEVFVNARGEPLSRWGFAYLLKQHAATAAGAHPGLDKKRISPHVLRHTCAMIILQATQDIRKVSLWLGHATLTTTEIYTRGDPTEKLDAMESIVPPHLRRGAFQPSDRLIALLKRPS